MTERIPVIKASSIPAVTREQMREVDRLMIEEYGVQLIQMMENAGLQLARLVRHLLGSAVQNGRVLVLAGRGNNGGGGLVTARRQGAGERTTGATSVATATTAAIGEAPESTVTGIRMMRLPSSILHGSAIE